MSKPRVSSGEHTTASKLGYSWVTKRTWAKRVHQHSQCSSQRLTWFEVGGANQHSPTEPALLQGNSEGLEVELMELFQLWQMSAPGLLP